ncbi:MAG: aminotransferase class I/II-fold pyridoxal phosphate-dependent enzyme [candidate division Zixibacteria bacterium]|nr:aminotransferase class I/II-fold pyridoxal phosphate-dependent enzyme [candidate division Zixibacteria bacterium]
MRKVIIVKADRLFKAPAPVFSEMYRSLRHPRHKGLDIIELGMVRSEFFADPDFSGEAGAILGNPGLRRQATPDEIADIRKKTAHFYFKQTGVKLNHWSSFAFISVDIPTEYLLCLGLINPGDNVAVCNPSDPTFCKALSLSSANIIYQTVSERTDYLPIPELPDLKTDERIKLKFLNFPHNPTGAVADTNFFDRQAKAASKGDYLICHRWGFRGLTNNSHPHPSLLQSPGTKKVAVELLGFNLGFGLKPGMLEIAVGSPDAIAVIKEIDSLISEQTPFYKLKLLDSAIRHCSTAESKAAEMIKTNANILTEGLKKFGWRTFLHKGAPFLWASHPRRKSSLNLSRILLKRSGIMVTPGSAFGENGEGFIRFALTATEGDIHEALARISKSLHPIKTGKLEIDKRIKELRDGQADT